MPSSQYSLVAILLLLLVAPANAYVRSTSTGRTGSGVPVSWASPIVTFEINSRGTKQLPDKEATFAAIRRAMDTWSAVTCTSLRFVDGGVTNREAGVDFRNVIVFRDTFWPYEPEKVAQTTVTVDRETGEIVDADVQLNAVHFQWSLGDSDVMADVQAIVTHELGHALGLNHPCNEKEGCPDAPELLGTTMYYLVPNGETDKRTLHNDDIDGVCAIYPVTMALEPEVSRLKLAQTQGGCQLGGPSQGAPSAAWLFAVMLGVWLTLRGRRSRILAR